MAWSPAARSAAQLAAGWALILGIAAVLFVHFDAIRDAVGLKLEPADFGAIAASDRGAPSTPAPSRASSGRSVEIRAGTDGHFHTTASINGRLIDVMVDTGASMVALTWEDAQTAGIFLGDGEFKYRVSTANGIARVASVTLDAVSIEDITIHNVRAAVAEPGKLQTTLLGMSFLGQLSRAEMSRGVLLLEK
jgi:aspartyl protease family protein